MVFVIIAGNENYTGIAARDTANALQVLAHAVRGVAAGTSNTQTQGYILSTAQQVLYFVPIHLTFSLILSILLTRDSFFFSFFLVNMLSSFCLLSILFYLFVLWDTFSLHHR